ncbi:Flavin-dependent oxidoreductase, luciferase family (includes alkanesulfonate monooxygenase SsuD and methylene tetrahydromethanopterin reductase) [Alteribacillus persepolensis]|uniref:Flavin-dependent oxidoreductase, luciferase family (Includes alkanesulfonate monooxygenase SsuD and methylene tetrahydromethanopterin reductase) n=1 Tax=Alteribacillus persepolensis TaxID=568899 RepID=A0A1G8HTA4_9BACI|nr:LLM class flavin-dependent oxidoreductase [Alteribacillus persepolensis]SDI09730.1 Flavin-dependent oxidoreductase, luciferase family (includes alkanesulfonate monooxygenase SsuD and methylene tetrahydromethanopterin reductase) [Alteribacillus persepolensis]
MKFGLFYVLECYDGKYEKAYNEMLEQIQYAEELGFESVWLAEHHFTAYGSMPSPQVAAAAIAQVTKTMDIGMAVCNLNFDNPVRIAEDFAMVDNLSNGRLKFGAGRGYQPVEFKGLGLEMKDTREVFWESVDIIKGLWYNDTFSYDGKHYQLENVSLTPKPVQERIPFYLAAISPATFDIAVEKGMTEFMCTPTLMDMNELKKYISETRSRMIKQGINPSIHMNLQMNIADTQEQAIKNVEKEMARYFDTVLNQVPGARGEKAAESYERFAEVAQEMSGPVDVKSLNEAGIALLEDPDTAIEKLEDIEKYGITSMSNWFRMGDMEHRKVMKTMKNFARDVMPYFKPTGKKTITQ